MDKFRAISYFLRSVETRSFSAAAQTLGVTPSALSKAITVLEHDLRVTLFNRSTRQLALTDEGATYYDQCRHLLQELEQVEGGLARGHVKIQGTLRIAIHPALRGALVRTLPSFLDANPDLKIEIRFANSTSALLEDGCDVLLKIGDPSDSGLVARKLGQTDLVVCATPDYLARKGVPAAPEDLSQHQALIPARPDERSFRRWEFSQGTQSRTIAVPIRVLFRDGNGMMEFLLAGWGVMRMYACAVEGLISSGQLTRVLPEWHCGSDDIYVVFPKSRDIPAKVRAFSEFASRLLRG